MKGSPTISHNSHCLYRDVGRKFSPCKTELRITCPGSGGCQKTGQSMSPQGQGIQSPAGSGTWQVRRENEDQGPTNPQQGRKEGQGAHLPPFVPFPRPAPYLNPTVDPTSRREIRKGRFWEQRLRKKREEEGGNPQTQPTRQSYTSSSCAQTTLLTVSQSCLLNVRRDPSLTLPFKPTRSAKDLRII